jgi:hypothetical protein
MSKWDVEQIHYELAFTIGIIICAVPLIGLLRLGMYKKLRDERCTTRNPQSPGCESS